MVTWERGLINQDYLERLYKIERVAEIANKYNVTKSQVAVAWLWNKGVTSPIVGITKEKYLDDFIGALDVKLSKEDMEYLEEKYAPHNIVGHK